MSIPHQMVGTAETEAERITVTTDNNDIFMVLLHDHLKNMSCRLLMEGPSTNRTVINIATL